jgi:hypothetical protein
MALEEQLSKLRVSGTGRVQMNQWREEIKDSSGDLNDF